MKLVLFYSVFVIFFLLGYGFVCNSYFGVWVQVFKLDIILLFECFDELLSGVVW